MSISSKILSHLITFGAGYALKGNEKEAKKIATEFVDKALEAAATYSGYGAGTLLASKAIDAVGDYFKKGDKIDG